MSGSHTRRIEQLESRTAVYRMVSFVAATTGETPATVIAEAERIMAATAGMTEAERNARIAADLGRTVAEVEADLAQVASEAAAWQVAPSPSARPAWGR